MAERRLNAIPAGKGVFAVPTGGDDFAFLIGATAPPDTPAAMTWEPGLAADIPVAALLALANTHGMVIPLARALSHKIPQSPLIQALRKPAKARTLRALALAGELARLAKKFAAAGIPVVALKGPALALELFGDVAARDPGDIDLLVHPEQLTATDRLLVDAGYQRPAVWDAAFAAGKAAKLYRRNYHIEYYRPGDGIMVEVHWRWYGIEQIANVDEALFWDGLRELEIGNTSVLVPAWPVQLLYLSFHAAKHQCEHFKWLHDLAWLLPKVEPAVIDAAMENASRFGIANLAAAPLLCLEKLGVARLPPAVAVLGRHPAVDHLAGLFCAVLADPLIRSGTITLRQRLYGHHVHWRLAAYRDDPQRLGLLSWKLGALLDKLGWGHLSAVARTLYDAARSVMRR
jgi:hypothetical protein